jgi:CheY-like chemotaxis protein
MNILIAEDTPIIQMLHRELMGYWGYNFDIASNGQEAVDLAQKNNGEYDLCLMDIEMPKMNGIEATKIIRKTAKYFPIMALTSNGDYKQECYEAGVDDFALKPCPRDDLLARIKKLSVKVYKLITKPNSLDITEVMPVDKQHAEELRELAKQGLCKMNIRGVGGHDLTVIVHKNVPNKISSDFVGNGDEVSVFLDRSPDRPAECHLYKSSCPMPVIFLKNDDVKEKQKAEDELLKDCVTMVVKNNKA